ncbi:unnamed protein product [Gongylonema pulchrum]|uniref:PPM-type phosphatase domain-containing protein n=1 Tax=Gongylonema pulchrum TaxID=637853 RepID=A0A183CZM7_9BILA|nr:unnamed protein product [Gongylonema pulchrum]
MDDGASPAAQQQPQQQQTDEATTLISLAQNYLHSSQTNGTESANIRFRPPFLQTPKHDARGDAVALIVEHLIQRQFPQWAAYVVAYSLVDLYASELQTADVPFDENDYDAIDATVWCPKVIVRLQSYLTKLAASSIPLPEYQPDPDQLLYSYCAQRNRRAKMEDRSDRSRNQDSFFAVFDGHNGVDCANYASSHFARCLIDNPEYATGSIEDVMKRAFSTLDKRLTVRCKREHIKSGTTAACAFLRARRHLCVGWCGDSAVAVLRKDAVRTLSSAHSPMVEVRSPHCFVSQQLKFIKILTK